MPLSDSGLVSALVTLLQTVNPPIAQNFTPPPLPDEASVNWPIPWIVVRNVTTKKVKDLSGDAGLAWSIMQVECWSNQYDSADVCRGLVKNKLEDIPSGTVVNNLTIDGSTHVIDTDIYNGSKELHQLITRYKVWWIG